MFASTFLSRGFLPSEDPLTSFPAGSPYAALDELGRDLPSLLHRADFRDYARRLEIPKWTGDANDENQQAELRLYYVRLGFLASAYVNQVGEPPSILLPRNIAVPLCDACHQLNRPPILSYDGYALFNWKRYDPANAIALGNIDTIQNFVHLYDEHWFILVHVEIEAIAAQVFAAMNSVAETPDDDTVLNSSLVQIADSVQRQVAVLRRIPEKMDPSVYFRTFRPYIRFFEDVVYEGVDSQPMSYRGETGAQSSILPALVSLMKVDHQRSVLTDHLADMRRFMPAEHRALLADIEQIADFKPRADRQAFNDVLEAMATFREVHYGWAGQYIDRWVDDPRGTGGTPYMQWLRQLIDETRAHQK